MVVKIPIPNTSCVVSVDANVVKWLNHHHKFGFKWVERLSQEKDHLPVRVKTILGYSRPLRRIIADAFVKGKQHGFQIGLKDRDENNLSLDNMEWISRSQAWVRKMHVKPTSTPGVGFWGKDKYRILFYCHGKRHRHIVTDRVEADSFIRMFENEFDVTYTSTAETAREISLRQA